MESAGLLEPFPEALPAAVEVVVDELPTRDAANVAGRTTLDDDADVRGKDKESQPYAGQEADGLGKQLGLSLETGSPIGDTRVIAPNGSQRGACGPRWAPSDADGVSRAVPV